MVQYITLCSSAGKWWNHEQILSKMELLIAVVFVKLASAKKLTVLQKWVDHLTFKKQENNTNNLKGKKRKFSIVIGLDCFVSWQNVCFCYFAYRLRRIIQLLLYKNFSVPYENVF